MMRYNPHTREDVERMCRQAGVESVEDLFSSVPENLRLGRLLGLPGPMDEIELGRMFRRLASRNAVAPDVVSFAGAGCYHHHVPAAVWQLAMRSEFYTAYTPYQPELSQGTLKAIFEYQTMIAGLTGMDVANASLYDGASALAEAVLLTLRVKAGRRKVVAPRTVHPDYLRTLRTYLRGWEAEIEEIGWDEAAGTTDLDAVRKALDGNTCALVTPYPNFFGCIEPLDELAAAAKSAGALLVCVTQEPAAFGLLKPPGELGADVFCGEGQSFGNPPNFGGPMLGLFATRRDFMRQMPGRLVGRTADRNGEEGYVLTLATREQHIRRAKATSNICTNEGLCALAAAIYLSLLGPAGLRRVAMRCLSAKKYAADRLLCLKGVNLRFTAPTFNELVVRVGADADALHRKLAGKGIVAGVPLGRFHGELDDCLLLCFTELHAKADIDRLCDMIGAE